GLVRYNTDGSLDSTFGDSGRVRDSFPGLGDITGLAAQADGKIVVAGYSYQGVTRCGVFVARYNADGTLDASFDGDGCLTTDFGSCDVAQSVAVQADGKIVAAGYSYQEGSTGIDFALARYDSSGALDTSFDSDGKVTTDFGGFDDYAQGVAVQADGKIVAAGYSYQ